MRIISIILLAVLMASQYGFAQKTNDNQGTSTTKSDTSKLVIDYFILSGGIGAGAVVSTNIINTGALASSNFDILFQARHNRFGFGWTNELFVTPESLGRLVFGESISITKFYLMYEWALFRRSPFNIGFSTQLGGFVRGDELDATADEVSRTHFNIGPLVEIGAPRFYLFVRPMIEYKSYGEGSWHKELSAVAQLGLRWKIPTEDERKRLENKKKKRKNRRKRK